MMEVLQLVGHSETSLTNLQKYPISLKKGKTYTQSIIVISGSLTGFTIVPSVKNSENRVTYNYFSNNSTKTAEEDYTIHTYNFYVADNKTVNCTFKVQLEESPVATEYEPYGRMPSIEFPSEIKSCGENGGINIKVCNKNDTEYQSEEITIPTQKPLRKIREYEDTFEKKNGKWYRKEVIEEIESYSNETIETEYISTTGELTQGATVYYVLEKPRYIEITDENIIQALEKLNKIKMYEPTTYIESTDEIKPTLKCTYKRNKEVQDGNS